MQEKSRIIHKISKRARLTFLKTANQEILITQSNGNVVYPLPGISGSTILLCL